jgi:uncharacterized protein YjiS (DUF1127 family)
MTVLTTKDTPTPASGVARLTAGGFAWLGDLINDAVKTFIACRERQIAIAMLHRFNDRELKDLGVPRCRIEAAAGGPYPDATERR